jgi:imidazolonepropionase
VPVEADLLVTGATELLTMDRPGVIPDGALAARDGVICWVGASRDATAEVQLTNPASRIDATGHVVLPGFIDCHSHFLFGGDRSAEFEARCLGKSYLDIAAAGGGIAATVAATAAMGDEALVASGVERAGRLLAQGVTTTEAKSGYGLSASAELRLLRALREVAANSALEISPTLLALHALPRGADRQRFVDEVIDTLIPAATEAGLCRQFDGFLEEGAFTKDEVRRAFEAARRAGLGLRLHADQLSPGGGAELCAELGAASADHLEQISETGIEALAKAHVPAVLLPAATLVLRLPRPAPAAALSRAGVTVALATNWNPGSAPTESVSLTLGLSCLLYGMSALWTLHAFTAVPAEVLGFGDRLGRLRAGYQADFTLMGCQDHRHLCAHFAANHARMVVKRGQIVARPPGLVCGV